MQGDLLGWTPRVSVPREDTSRPSIEERWAEFHRSNPHVFAEALRLSRVAIDRGDRYLSVKALYEQMRTTLATNGDAFRLNNDFTRPLSRALIEAESRLATMIRTREPKR